MLRTILAAVGVLLLIFVAYAAWVIIGAGDSTGIRPVVTSEILSGRIRVTVTLSGVDSEHEITEVIFPREFGEQLEISAPPEFRLTPYKLEDTSEPNSSEASEWVASANRRDIRWTGSVLMPPDVPVVLEFPIRYKISGNSMLRFQYERKIGISGQLSFFNVPIEITED